MPKTAPLLLLALAACARPSTSPAPAAPADHASDAAPEAPLTYPEARRADVTDDFFGTTVADPYRWLEDPDSDETRAWIQAQNDLSGAWLSEIPAREAIHDRLEGLWAYERYGVPTKKGGRYFFTHNDGLQDQPVLYVADALDADKRVLVDPNAFSDDGTRSLAGWAVSEDGKRIAYGISDGGSDWSTWRVRDVETGEDLADEIRWVKFSGATWTHDGQGFFYGRYPESENPLEQANRDYKLYYHRIGTPQDQDVLVYERPDQPEWGFGTEITHDGRTLLIHVWQGTEEKNRVYLHDLTRPIEEIAETEPVHLLDAFDAGYHFLGSEGTRYWFKTDLNAPRGRIVAIDTTSPAPEAWDEIVPQAPETLESASLVGGRLVLSYLRDAHQVVRVHELDGAEVSEVALPGLGSAGGFQGEPDDPETFFYFTSYTHPTTIYRYDAASGDVTPWRTPSVDFDPADYVTEQVFYESADGTKIPMFLTHKRGIERDGANPTLLYGYGGFNVPLTPGFSPARLVWMERGGVYAVANLRGGGEYGKAWHEAGTKLNKQNVFDDFIAAGEWLVDQGYTRPDKLAIQGRSNGGLLVGATMLQRPDLFGAVLPGVGVLDMLRYHRFTIGWAWASDYGTAEDSEEMFSYLLGYSPVHNAEPGTAYPPTLVQTADHDDRVVPAHSFKFTAALQHAQAGAAPILARIETRAGHGAGKSTSMRILEAADEIAFMTRALGLPGGEPESGE